MIPVIPLPNRSELGQDASEKWQLFKQRWTNYVTISGVEGENNREKLRALFLH